MNFFKKTIFTFALTLGLANLSFGQTEPYEQIEKALANSDIETLVSMAPKPEFGTLQFSTPGNSEISIKRGELGEHLTKCFNSIGKFEYKQLFADKVGHLPLVVGKLTGENATQYVMIGMANFGESYNYVSFSFLDKLPSNMRKLDK